MALVKSGDQEAKNAAERADALHKQYTRLQRVVENRIQLALIYVSFLKLKQQVCSFDRFSWYLLMFGWAGKYWDKGWYQ